MPRQSVPPELSVVIPVHNEQGNLSVLDRELKSVLERLGRPYEVIYINDGSTDGSLEELKAIPRITILELNRRYGQATALSAGFKAAAGETIISLDSDGQNDPADIPLLLKKLKDENLDVVAGWRKKRRDNGNIRLITVVARLLRRLLIGDIVHDSGCTLRVYTREAVKSLDIGGEMHRYLLALLKWKGFRIGEMAVNHRPRTVGVSKYGADKAFRGLIDLIYIWFIHKYSQRPLHLFGYMGIGAFALGTAAGLWSLYGKLSLGLSLNRNGWFFVTFFFLLAGVVFFSFGIVIDLLMQIRFSASKSEERYHVRESIKTD
jgi:glycosyltransferase involved in cell wall biosynthesis